MAQKLNHHSGSKIEPDGAKIRYARTPENVLTDRELSTSARVVYAFLSMWVFQGTICRKGQRAIAERLGFSRNTVAAAIEQLKERGHIGIEQTGRQRAAYQLNSPVFGQKQGRQDVIVSGPRGRRFVSIDNERHGLPALTRQRQFMYEDK